VFKDVKSSPAGFFTWTCKGRFSNNKFNNLIKWRLNYRSAFSNTNFDIYMYRFIYQWLTDVYSKCILVHFKSLFHNKPGAGKMVTGNQLYSPSGLKFHNIYITTAILLQCVLYSCISEKERVFIPTTGKIAHIHNYYKSHEYLKYSAQYGFLQVGEFTLNCDQKTKEADGHTCYRVSANGKAKGIAGELSSLNDVWESLVDTLTLLPYKFSRDLKENKYRKKEYTIFNHSLGTAEVVDTTELTVDKKSFPITPDIEDMLSVYYLLRNVQFAQLKEGDTIVLDAFIENAPYNIQIKYLGKEKINTEFGKTSSIVIAPLIQSVGMLSGEYPVKAWLSDDEQKIPLKARINITLGSVELNLQEYVQDGVPKNHFKKS
jgi:hypothetical protein